MMQAVGVYVEAGSRRVFAGALDWPGWCRSGRDEAAALRALLDYGPRYRATLGRAGRGFTGPKAVEDLTVLERFAGDATTDFGAPAVAPAYDAQPLGTGELKRLTTLLRACWVAFDASAEAATGTPLRKGPRGGGRDVVKMTAHVLEADASYLTQLGARPPKVDGSIAARMQQVRDAFVDALAARARGDLPDRGPRGGVRWTARYAVRRSAWHALDHAWEIQDRVEATGTVP